MSLGQRIAIVLLAIVLVASLVGTNVVMTAERTALDAEYVTTTLEEEDAYAEANDLVEQSIIDSVDGATLGAVDQLPDAIDTSDLTAEALVADALTETYVKTQIDENIDESYAYLHGEQETLSLAVDLTPVKSNLTEAVSDRMVDIDAAALSQAAFERLDTDVPVESTIVQQLLANESSYQQSKADFQDSIPESVSQDDVNRQLKDDLETATRDSMSEYDEPLTDAVVEMQFVTVDALTTDMTYQEYRQAIDDSKQRIADRIQQLVRDRLDEEVPDTVSVTDQMDENALNRLETAQRGVGLIDFLNWLLPAIALVVLVLAYLVSRSPWSVGLLAGWGALIAGISGLLPAMLARGPVTTLLRNTISGAGSEQFADVAVALVGGILTTLRNQSLLLLLVGIALLAIVYADRGGHLDGVRRELGFGPAPRRGTVSDSSRD
ncbi:MAG: hypothetical protein ACOCQY_03515 [Halorhabdus sp.]